MNSIKLETDLMIVSQFFDLDGERIFDCSHLTHIKGVKDACLARFISTKREMPEICPTCKLKLKYDYSKTKKTTYQNFRNNYFHCDKYFNWKKVKMSPIDRMKAEQLKMLVKKENKTLEEMKLEADLSYYLDQRGLCFTDL